MTCLDVVYNILTYYLTMWHVGLLAGNLIWDYPQSRLCQVPHLTKQLQGRAVFYLQAPRCHGCQRAEERSVIATALLDFSS
jgi:hypothetical protein